MTEVYFLDSSAVVKRYVPERGSAWVSGLMDPALGNRIYVAAIAGAEVVAALGRRKASIPFGVAREIAEFRADFDSRFRVVEVSLTLIHEAMDLAERHGLRGYDSVQLASAITVHSECAASGEKFTFLCADVQLVNAAAAEGLSVGNPNDQP